MRASCTSMHSLTVNAAGTDSAAARSCSEKELPLKRMLRFCVCAGRHQKKQAEFCFIHHLEMTNFGWGCFPIIAFAVQISNGRVHEFLWRHIVKAGQIHCIELAPARRASDTERADTAVPAKQMLVCLGQKLIFSEISLARQQAKRTGLYDGRPKSHLGANRAITAD